MKPLARALALPAALVLVLFAYSRIPPATTSAGPTPRLVLTDDYGAPFDLAAHHGGVVLVTFGYTHCRDVCPMTLSALDAVSERLGADRQRVTQVFVTLDPDRDTPAVLHAFLARFSPAPVGLTGTPAAIDATARSWGVTSRPAAGGAYVDHTALVAVIGPDGRERRRYGFGQLGDPDAVAHDITRLLHAG